MPALFQLHIDDKPAGPTYSEIKYPAADAMDSGFADADSQGRIILHESADIVKIAEWPCKISHVNCERVSCTLRQRCLAN